jgi:thioesterase domain-containing protein/acyl carrier protein
VAVRLFAKIKNHFSLDLGLATLFDARTIEALANVIRKPDDRKAQSPIVPMETSGSKPALFLIHGVGGKVVVFENLAKGFSSDQPIYAIQSQAQTGPALRRVEDIAAYYIREMRRHQPEGPYSFIGYSFGGIVALEIAQQLHAMGEQVGLVGLLDTWHPGYSMGWLLRAKRWTQYVRKTFTGPYKVRYLRSLLRQKYWQIRYLLHIASRKNVPQSFARVLDANSLAARNYTPRPYPGRVVLFKAAADQADPRLDAQMGWGGLATEGLEVHEVPGTHLDLFQPIGAAVLAQQIEGCLERAAHSVLPPASPSSRRAPSKDAPRNRIEDTLAKWWQELLGLDHVSIHDDFFELGGQSLVAVRLLARIEKEFEKSIPMHVFFEDHTIEALADHILGGKPEAATAIDR